ncbi:hypothetical protein LXM25_00020 [Dyadobacter sp. LJ53]|uniref:hypothetical protein n=1 Tax=Dyadobacter chenwenxiniae TaxID=2906456 RepID=UPI001F459278|nr:hypothetical protein [Dyadobacter chenwenxiniae]MCF0048418.1 hypothetical protein [Dyadobacter chenwenxiniae]
MIAKKLKNLHLVSFRMILALTLLSNVVLAQQGTATFRQKIKVDLPSNNNKAITAAKLRSVFDASADAIDAIYNNLSLANSLGNYDASTNTATLKEAGTTFNPTTTANQTNGKYFNVVVAGTQSITGTSVSMQIGGVIISRGTKWDYIPPTDTGYIKSLQNKKDVAIGEIVTESNGHQAFNGATSAGGIITIPNGQTGVNTLVSRNLSIANHPEFEVGKVLKFSIIWGENVPGITNLRLTTGLTVVRNGANQFNQFSNRVVEYINDNKTIRTTFYYTVQAGDEILQPFIQVGVGSAANASGSDYVFTLKNMYTQITNPTVDVSGLTDKFVKSDIKISDKILNHSVVPTRYTGEALGGATGVASKRITIPSGQTGSLSYIRAEIPIAEFPNWSDLIGVPVTITYKVLMSADLYPAKSLTSNLQVTRSGSLLPGAMVNNTILKLSPTVLKVSFTYTPQAGDTSIWPYIQTPNGAAVGADWYFEMQEITYTHAVPLGFNNTNDYSLAKEKASYIALIRSLTTRLNAVEVAAVTVKTVSPDGTKDYLSPKLAMDAISDNAKSKPYLIVVYPGTYTETEWTVKPYCHIQGTNRDLCILKGELPVNALDATITNTSTLWLVKTASLKNLTITARNMRYAIHNEDSGNNPDAVHNIDNCYIRHFGQETANAYRTANSLPPVSWTSTLPMGYGAGSGVIGTFENSTFVSTLTPWSVHSNLNFSKPNINTLSNSSLISERLTAMPAIISIQNLGSGTNDLVDVRNCDFSPGYIYSDDNPWITQDPLKQYANHQEYSINISGHKKPLGFRSFHRGLALKIESQNTVGASTVRVTGTAADAILGTPNNRDFGYGVKGYTYGHWDISGILVGLASNVTVNNTIGRRLGDCSTVNKVLNVVVNGGAPIVITFNTNLTSVSNATILATINAALGANATASTYNPVANEFYPEMNGMQISLKNNSATKTIPQYAAVCYDTSKSTVRVMTSADPASSFIGFALFPIAPGETKRVLTEGNLHRSQAAGLSAATIVFGTNISMSATEGTVETGSSKIIGQGLAADWFYFKGNI